MRDYSANTGVGARAGVYARTALGGLPKRALDITVASIALVALGPILLAMAGLIRALIGKPVYAANEWVGFEGKAFACYRFCPTGANSTSSRLDDQSWTDGLARALDVSGLDRLPLLINVLRGDMSLIGPRPITVRQLSHYNGLLPEYLLARPGITGVWRRTRRTRRTNQMALDRYYARYWSVRLDLGLLVEAISRIG